MERVDFKDIFLGLSRSLQSFVSPAAVCSGFFISIPNDCRAVVVTQQNGDDSADCVRYNLQAKTSKDSSFSFFPTTVEDQN